MAKKTWKIANDTVEFSQTFLGKGIVRLNGVELARRSIRKLDGFAFELPDGSEAQLGVAMRVLVQPAVTLRLNGRVHLDEKELAAFKCRSCGGQLQAADEFCDACGKPAPDPAEVLHGATVGQATNTIRAVSILYLAAGVFLFFVGRGQYLEILEDLSPFADDELLDPIEGVAYTAGELRNQVRWEMWSVLIFNLVLAAFMAGFAFWSRSQPLAAIVSATALYVTVIVLNAAVEPATLGQGAVLKVLVIAFFIRGIKSSLQLRDAT